MRALRLLAAILIAGMHLVTSAQGPVDFHWIPVNESSAELSTINAALKTKRITGLQRVALAGHHALVFARIQEEGSTEPLYDYTPVYEVDLQSKATKLLLGGHRVRTKGWLNFDGSHSDLGITYLDCWECEPASIFTAIHYDPSSGWTARWGQKGDPTRPGMWFLATDVGDPYTDEKVDQVFAVIQNRQGRSEAGRWYHALDLKTHKSSDDVMKCSVDLHSVESCVSLEGKSAKAWRRELCGAKEVSQDLRIGQASESCKALLAISEER